jgi:hypothetical protein
MKRFYLSAIILAAVTAGCTKSSIVESSISHMEAIEFDSYAGRIPVTRASNTTIDVLKAVGFQAIAYNSGDYVETYLNEVVTYDTEKGKWTYGDKKIYWPEGSNLDFVAYGSNVNKTATVSKEASVSLVSEFSEASFTYSVPDYVSEQEDLVVAAPWLNHNNKTETGNVVKFDFKHVLSKIGFNIVTNNDYTGENANPVDVTIKNIRLRANMYNKGTVHLLASSPKVVPDPNSLITSYSLFDHNYPSADATEYDENGLLKGFVCHNSTTSVPVYQNIKFNPNKEDYTEVAVPEDDQDAINNRFMMILPAEKIGNVKDTDDIDGDGNRDENVPPYIEVVYQLTGGREEIVRAYLGDYGVTSFAAGKWYEFTLKVSTTAVKFAVKITEGWSVEEDPLKDDSGNDQA